MITNLLLGIIFVFISLSVFGQEKPKKAMAAKDSLNEVVVLDSKGLSVSQSGKENSVEVSQVDGNTNINSQGNTTTVISKNGNRIVHRHRSNTDSTGTNAASVNQSGSGNRVVIRQSGSGNSVSVSQSPEKKKED
jgi:ABC-type Na+ efflux pump permease subunit